MYRHCIYCSADLRTNEALEAFPIGRTVAFDAEKGRLWAVCGSCSRWNLSPFEERWEPVEQAERAFRDTRLRVQSENVGLARLPDGTRLIRVGEALHGEMAAWRYGRTLVNRRKQYLIGGTATVAAGLALMGGLSAVGMAGMSGMFAAMWSNHQRKRVVYRVPASASPDGVERTVRRWHISGAWLGPASEAEGIALYIPDVDKKEPKDDWRGEPKLSDRPPLVLQGESAQRALSRSLVRVNEKGAKEPQIEGAIDLIVAAGPDEYIRRTAEAAPLLGKRRGQEARRIDPVASLALEMALHEAEERRALEGELDVLEAAWREAEEIAGIADWLATATARLT